MTTHGETIDQLASTPIATTLDEALEIYTMITGEETNNENTNTNSNINGNCAIEFVDLVEELGEILGSQIIDSITIPQQCAPFQMPPTPKKLTTWENYLILESIRDYLPRQNTLYYSPGNRHINSKYNMVIKKPFPFYERLVNSLEVHLEMISKHFCRPKCVVLSMIDMDSPFIAVNKVCDKTRRKERKVKLMRKLQCPY
ncbi:8441_t:CDS:2 [Paraglomus occultum]|uniref:8441_t:CDS:1 n=1 Tax=Paraglomus occultum TaxID=144539 RepID=A0A9N8VVZ8_9GLOM|nr:8441_t:CDS:2 [Paraglomus occultum]